MLGVALTPTSPAVIRESLSRADQEATEDVVRILRGGSPMHRLHPEG